mmetsp:Transcript_3959/g.13883  ORF Transcript_3959/g.13883 Transcript_3959/m.13883 type:complete len:88 (-) Transcript_3959:301-564(-)
MGGHDGPPAVATPEEMAEAKLPLTARDACASLLIPLNKCRRENMWWPGTCEHEKHAYEKCQYQLYMARVNKLAAEKAEAKAAKLAGL